MCLQTSAFRTAAIIFHGMYPAITQYGEVLAQIDLRDFDGGEEVGFLRAIQDIG